MNYSETLDWMFGQLPMYQRQGASAYRKDLTNTLKLCAHLGNPEADQKFVHVAGTNGKGSTSHMIASVLMEAGLKTGLFTSPHLIDFRERIKVNGIEIDRQYVIDFIQRNKTFFENNNLSFFEMTTGLAFEYFKHSGCDIVVLETGMGGRLDSTNVVTPILSVITNIGMDHTTFLGETLAEIAAEKAGIIKPGIPVVVGEYTSETKDIFLKKAAETKSPIIFAADVAIAPIDCDLKGSYQKANIRTATTALKQLNPTFKIDEKALKDGFANVVKNTGLRGRWEVLTENPLVICDTAHNAHGLAPVVQQLLSMKQHDLHVVFGMVNDKDPDCVLEILPKEAKYYFCRPDIPRGLKAGVLQAKAAAHGLQGTVNDSVAAAYENAMKEAHATDIIFIGGSTFVVAEILQKNSN